MHRAARPILVLLALALATIASPAAGQPTPNMLTRFDAGGLDLAEGVAIAADGRVALTGVGEVGGQQDFVTVVFDQAGEVAWSSVIDKGGKDRGAGVGFDTAGNLYAVGTVRTAGDDVLLVKFNPQGTETWRRVFDKGTSETARALAVDHGGNVVVVGSSLSPNGADGFVVKFSPQGDELWSKPVNVFWLDEFFAVTTDRDGNVIAAGRVAREANFDAFVRKFSSTGDVKWTQYLTGAGNDEGRGVAADAAGNVFVTGTTTVLRETAASSRDTLVAKFSPDGEALWKKEIDVGGAEDEGRGAATDPGGNVLFAGFAKIHGNKDPFVLKLDPTGRVIWRHSVPGSGIDGVGSIAVSPDGRQVVVAGASQKDGRDFDYLVVRYDQGRPTASFSFTPARPAHNTTIAFADASAPGNVPIASWHWDFGDGSTGAGQNPTHAYAWGGTYPVELTVRDDWGNAQSTTRTVVVSGPRNASSPAATGTGSEPDGTTPATTPGSAGPTGPPVGDDTVGESTRGRIPGPDVAAVALAVAASVLLLPRGRAR